ncbi:alpha/beta hydrolase [Mesorhizobium sp. IMUNJ 23232]|uniref:alpha/beta hydrolase n=1 Tax=Mesorhizobium sp. IMUNJ 23232 TaxID=3376064 RepID=UPI003794443C
MMPGKYETLLDPETHAYVDQVNRLFPSAAADLPISEQRVIYDAMCGAFHCGYPAGVVASDALIDRSIPIRRYRAEGRAPIATVVYYHGGGFVFGGLNSHDDICAELCAGSGCDIVSVDYRLAPEHVHPAAFDDARAAFAWASATADLPLLLCGESAGGNLAAAVAHAVRGEPHRLIGQVLIYPGLGGDTAARSYVEHAEAPLLGVRDIEFYRYIRTGGAAASEDPTLEPLRDRDFSNLPPTVIFTAECDPLSSDGKSYRDRILAVAGRAFWFEEPRLTHSYLRARSTDPRARAAFGRIVDAVAALARGYWPY